jgi:hypothetical protein
LFLGQHLMNLRMTRTADAYNLAHEGPIELTLVPFVMMSRPRNEMVARQPFLAITDGAMSFHVNIFLFSSPRSNALPSPVLPA